MLAGPAAGEQISAAELASPGTQSLPCHLSAPCQELGLLPPWNSMEEPLPVEPWLPWYLQHLKEMSESLQGLELRVLRRRVLCFFSEVTFPTITRRHRLPISPHPSTDTSCLSPAEPSTFILMGELGCYG